MRMPTMKFQTPGGVPFEVPDDWWQFTEMKDFHPSAGSYYPYSEPKWGSVQIISLSEIEASATISGHAAFQEV
jgi:hypothetical protein